MLCHHYAQLYPIASFINFLITLDDLLGDGGLEAVDRFQKAPPLKRPTPTDVLLLQRYFDMDRFRRAAKRLNLDCEAKNLSRYHLPALAMSYLPTLHAQRGCALPAARDGCLWRLWTHVKPVEVALTIFDARHGGIQYSYDRAPLPDLQEAMRIEQVLLVMAS